MDALLDAFRNLMELWPLFLLLSALIGAAVRVMIRAETKTIEKETNKKLYHGDGSLIYALRADFNKEVVSLRKDFQNQCKEHRDTCRTAVCHKIDGVLIKLNDMDRIREKARQERMTALDKHTTQIESVSRDLSKLLGRFDTLEKTVLKGG